MHHTSVVRELILVFSLPRSRFHGRRFDVSIWHGLLDTVAVRIGACGHLEMSGHRVGYGIQMTEKTTKMEIPEPAEGRAVKQGLKSLCTLHVIYFSLITASVLVEVFKSCNRHATAFI